MKKVSHGRMRKIKENRRAAEIQKIKFRYQSSRNCNQEVLGKWLGRLEDAVHMYDPIWQRMKTNRDYQRAMLPTTRIVK